MAVTITIPTDTFTDEIFAACQKQSERVRNLKLAINVLVNYDKYVDSAIKLCDNGTLTAVEYAYHIEQLDQLYRLAKLYDVVNPEYRPVEDLANDLRDGLADLV